MGEAEVEDGVSVLLQALHLHARDGLAQALELSVPRGGRCGGNNGERLPRLRGHPARWDPAGPSAASSPSPPPRPLRPADLGACGRGGRRRSAGRRAPSTGPRPGPPGATAGTPAPRPARPRAAGGGRSRRGGCRGAWPHPAAAAAAGPGASRRERPLPGRALPSGEQRHFRQRKPSGRSHSPASVTLTTPTLSRLCFGQERSALPRSAEGARARFQERREASGWQRNYGS